MFRADLDKKYELWQADIFNPITLRYCQDCPQNFASTYHYFFGDSIFEDCTHLFMFIHGAKVAQTKGDTDELEQIVNQTKFKCWMLYNQIGRQVIQ